MEQLFWSIKAHMWGTCRAKRKRNDGNVVYAGEINQAVRKAHALAWSLMTLNLAKRKSTTVDLEARQYKSAYPRTGVTAVSIYLLCKLSFTRSADCSHVNRVDSPLLVPSILLTTQIHVLVLCKSAFVPPNALRRAQADHPSSSRIYDWCLSCFIYRERFISWLLQVREHFTRPRKNLFSLTACC